MKDNKIHHIYDRAFKKILTLSSTAIINLINGLFETNYPTDSIITYNWTEFENHNLKRVLADTIITINHKYSYHMEAQMTTNNSIIFRVFEYGYNHANRQPNLADNELIFPEPIIIYLYHEGNIPDEYTLKLNFGSQGSFDYTVKTFKYLETSLDELNKRKMIILIPFQLLKLRKLIEKERSEENLTQLKKLIQNDIIGSIEENFELGNLTFEDCHRLKSLTHMLYNHIYSHYYDLEVITEMDQSLMLDVDYIFEEFDKKMAEKQKALAEKDNELAEKNNELAEKDIIIAEKNNRIKELEEQIESLKKI